MLTGDLVTLRPVTPADYPLLYAWRTDIATWLDTTEQPPVPLTFEAFAEQADKRRNEATDNAEFAVDAGGALVGRCVLFHVDPLARNAEVGLGFGPEHRGKGYGRDTLRVLLRYAFAYRNLHRVHLECTARNVAALKAYAAVGFVEEGRAREQAWVDGEYMDMVRMGLLRSEWAG